MDYQGRSFLHAPHDVGVNLKSDTPPDRCFLPKSHIHTWSGHTKGIAAVRWFPRTAHLLLSASMDCRIKASRNEIFQNTKLHTLFFHKRRKKLKFVFNVLLNLQILLSKLFNFILIFSVFSALGSL